MNVDSIMNDDPMGFMYIAEQTSPEDNKLSNLSVHDKNGVFFVQFDTCLQSFEVINRNNRQYLSSNVEECLKMNRIVAMLKDNAWYGEMDHPLQKYKDKPLSAERINTIEMSRRSHKIMNPSFGSNLLNATIQTASGTDAGRGFANEIIQGLIPAFSCRAIAGLKMHNGKPTVFCRKVITYDWVLYPSHEEAHATSQPVGITKTMKTITESVKEKVTEFSQDILLPLKEILEFTGTHDVNAQVIMESFELTNDDLIGFTPDRSHMIMKDNTNTIYAKISKESVNEVKDFYESFKL